MGRKGEKNQEERKCHLRFQDFRLRQGDGCERRATEPKVTVFLKAEETLRGHSILWLVA